MDLIVKVEKVNGTLVTTSNRVAEELGVEHKSLLRKIDDYIEKFGSTKLCHEFYIESTFKNRGKDYRNYLITKKGIAQLIGGYNSSVKKAFGLNVAYINEFERMENALNSISERDRLLLGLFSNDKMVVAESHKKLLELELKPLQDKIEEDRPKVDYYEEVLHPAKLIPITLIAKDLGMSAMRLNKILKDIGIQYKLRKSWVLTSKYQHLVPEYADYIINEYGQSLQWTEKGRQWIISMISQNE